LRIYFEWIGTRRRFDSVPSGLGRRQRFRQLGISLSSRSRPTSRDKGKGCP